MSGMRPTAKRGSDLFAGIRARVWASTISFLALTACGAPPVVPEQPTWVDVQPILRGECASCHGGSAASAGSAAGIAYRLDFFDMNRETCGDAAGAIAASRFAAAAASQIAFDITSASATIRPRMPPAPGAALADWEWQTILRWTSSPKKGTAPLGNAAPTIRITSPSRVVKRLFTVSAVLEDSDGDSAVAVVRIGDEVSLRLDRPGAFAIDVDATQWPAGAVPVSATVCDGWRQATQDLGVYLVSD